MHLRHLSYYGHAYCHVLTAALLELAPAGEVFGLCVAGTNEVVHTAFRVPHTDIYVDVFGPAQGIAGLAAKAREFAADQGLTWQPLSPVALSRLVGVHAAGLRRARPVARELLAAAEMHAGTIEQRSIP